MSNADPDQIRTAQEVLGGRLVSVQNQFSPAFRSSEPEIDLCAEMGPWSPLRVIGSAGGLGPEHAAFAEIARDKGVTPQQVCLRRCASSRRSSACTSSGTPQNPWA